MRTSWRGGGGGGIGRVKSLYNKVKSKPITPIILRLLRRIGIYPHSKYEK